VPGASHQSSRREREKHRSAAQVTLALLKTAMAIQAFSIQAPPGVESLDVPMWQRITGNARSFTLLNRLNSSSFLLGPIRVYCGTLCPFPVSDLFKGGWSHPES
jgi:hypothetical protein